MKENMNLYEYQHSNGSTGLIEASSRDEARENLKQDKLGNIDLDYMLQTLTRWFGYER